MGTDPKLTRGPAVAEAIFVEPCSRIVGARLADPCPDCDHRVSAHRPEDRVCSACVRDEARMKSVSQFTLRCADGQVIAHIDPGALYGAAEDAAADARTYDSTCLCGGPHKVLIRHITTTAWAEL